MEAISWNKSCLHFCHYLKNHHNKKPEFWDKRNRHYLCIFGHQMLCQIIQYWVLPANLNLIFLTEMVLRLVVKSAKTIFLHERLLILEIWNLFRNMIRCLLLMPTYLILGDIIIQFLRKFWRVFLVFFGKKNEDRNMYT